jgi:DNA-binding transcriptional MerR regulator
MQPAAMAHSAGGWMTIENLSLRSGVTTRNIRAYQSRGLLAPPLSRPGTRAAFYTPEHLARLRLVNRLQERGFSLAGIADLLDALAAGKSIEQVLGLESAIIASQEDQSRLVSERELRTLIPAGIDGDAAIKRLLAIGLLDRHERKYRIRYGRVFDLGVEALRAGIPIDELLDEFVRLRADLHDVALRFVTLFAGHVLRPFIEAGLPKNELPLILERMKHLRQLAVEATDALMRQAIADEIETVARATLPAPSPAPQRRPPK